MQNGPKGPIAVKDDRGQLLRALGLVSTLGLMLVVHIGVGLFLGYWLDQGLSSSPWGILIGAFLGVASGFRAIYKKIVDEG